MRDEWKFPTPVARLYSLVGVEGAVRTPRGLGTLRKAHSYPKGYQVELLAERETVKNGGKNPPPIMRAFDHEEVQEA